MVRSLRGKKDKKQAMPYKFDLSHDDRCTIEVPTENTAVV
jgi:hypothetical protein